MRWKEGEESEEKGRKWEECGKTGKWTDQRSVGKCTQQSCVVEGVEGETEERRKGGNPNTPWSLRLLGGPRLSLLNTNTN